MYADVNLSCDFLKAKKSVQESQLAKDIGEATNKAKQDWEQSDVRPAIYLSNSISSKLVYVQVEFWLIWWTTQEDEDIICNNSQIKKQMAENTEKMKTSLGQATDAFKVRRSIMKIEFHTVIEVLLQLIDFFTIEFGYFVTDHVVFSRTTSAERLSRWSLVRRRLRRR